MQIIKTANSTYELNLKDKLYRRQGGEWAPMTACCVLKGHLYMQRPSKAGPLVTSLIGSAEPPINTVYWLGVAGDIGY